MLDVWDSHSINTDSHSIYTDSHSIYTDSHSIYTVYILYVQLRADFKSAFEFSPNIISLYLTTSEPRQQRENDIMYI